MATMLRVKNLEKFQHYSKRRPPWIKLHRSILEDYHFRRLPDAAKAHAMLLWVIASGCDNALHDDGTWLAQLCGATNPIDTDLLVSAGFLERYEPRQRKRRASKPLAPRSQNGGTEVEGETEGETEAEGDTKPPLPAPRKKRAARPREVETVTWITPALHAWEAAYGVGSFDIGQGLRELKGLYRKGNGLTPEAIARRLAFYLAQKGSEVALTREQLERRHWTPSLRDFRLRHGAFDPDAPAEAA